MLSGGGAAWCWEHSSSTTVSGCQFLRVLIRMWGCICWFSILALPGFPQAAVLTRCSLINISQITHYSLSLSLSWHSEVCLPVALIAALRNASLFQAL